MAPEIAIIGAGTMGSAVAERLGERGCKVTTVLEGRSAASLKRAAAARMVPVSMEQTTGAAFILSIVPPAMAQSVAGQLAPSLAAARSKPVYVDCNAVSPKTVRGIAEIVSETGADFVDASIIGPPPQVGGERSVFYAAGPAASRFAALAEYGLVVNVLDGPVGAASGLKMCFAGMTKGVTAITTAMILAASRAGAAEALRAELAASRPELLTWCEQRVPGMSPKAYRWVREMQEIAEFAGEDESARQMYLGIARLYERMASDLQGERREIDALERFCALTSPPRS